MRKLILFTFLIFLVATINAINSPHGAKLKVACAVCHTTENWSKIKENGFNHNTTKFPLVGQHKMVDCRKCHTSLDFSKATTNCASCHTDIHEGTVGNDCASCHKTNSWIVTNIRQIHRQQGFPLLGEHAAADCNRCHTSASALRFNNIRTDCYSCHQFQYENTIKPNHKTSGFGTDCERCHNMAGVSWNLIGKGFDHGVFPLTGAHNIACENCHFENNYSVKLSTECSSCHSPGPANTTSPVHTTKFLKFACNDCHNTTSWSNGIKFIQHDGSYGRIYSGKHKGKWNSCTDCHNNDAAYVANCLKCHNFSSGSLDEN
ncbi:MAG: cytochrome c3 family protein [Paludibacter sp.]|nr:cytochrome c3 family protein [Paludibacter sp.]